VNKEKRSFGEDYMPAGNSSASHVTGKSDRSVNPVFGSLVCAAVMALAFASLWVGMSGLVNPDPAGGLLRTLGGFVGFFLIFGLTLVAAVKQK
jgi:hypothetical protein